jgi:arabinose-5-phosphate isomerase
MTAAPVSIDGDKLAIEVLVVLEHHLVDDVVVIDENHRPIGIIDSQDLSRLKLL